MEGSAAITSRRYLLRALGNEDSSVKYETIAVAMPGRIILAIILTAFAAGSTAYAATQKVLYSFTGGKDGGAPFYGPLLRDQAGNLYGTTSNGGQSGAGTIFKLTR